MAKVARNWMHIRPGSPAYVVSNNACDYFELGERESDDFWLEGRVEAGEFVLNGRLFAQHNAEPILLSSFPRHAPAGFEVVRRDNSVELVRDGVALFAFEVTQGLCRITANVYAADGALVAEARDKGFELLRGPALIGRAPERQAA